MARSYWLFNSNRSRVKRFIEKTNNKDKFYKKMFIDSGKVTQWGKEPPVMTTREELKKDGASEEWKKLIAQACRRTEEDWTKKES